jgi:hypothetical protein
MSAAGQELAGDEGVDAVVDSVERGSSRPVLHSARTEPQSGQLMQREDAVLAGRQVRNRRIDGRLV